ncbi:MAG TPA: hypothetical protein VEV41_00660 [Terriglobales bacterium]|nr:hypothetical protein [Terriglobales bacterium]
MTHTQLIKSAEHWLRSRRCHIVLSEQTADSGEVPDVIGWRRDCHSVVIECKISRPDFFADRKKPVRQKPETGMGCERFYLTPHDLLKDSDLPDGWGLLELRKREIVMRVRANRSQRSLAGLMAEMELLLASLRRVEVRIEPQTITDFLKWTNRMAAYNGGRLPHGLERIAQQVAP